ncbi:DASS family sodium-coupled anion symporter [Leptolyngbya sp. 15MV]|nr:DASS family sodium-coupled anion symporter [Leptolyngbya sp. 15MV]
MDDTRTNDSPWIAWAGFAAGPVVALIVYAALADSGLSNPGRATLAAVMLMATWWLTEALPLQATALVPLALFPVVGIAPIRATAAPYADPVIFLFLGGMLLGAAMERWNLHRRIALVVILAVGSRAELLLGGVMLATATISMWVSNTATTIMMLPIAVSIVALVHQRLVAAHPAASPRDLRNFATAMMLGVAYGATIGGVATIIGSPPNAAAVGFLQRVYGYDVSFLTWAKIGLPIVAIFLPLTWLVLSRVTHPFRLPEVQGVREQIRAELAALGRMSRGERLTAVVFALASLLWIFRDPLAGALGLYTTRPSGGREYWLTDPGIAIAAAILLFAIPVEPKKRVFILDWRTASRIPWGVLLLFGGGLTLSAAIEANGVDRFIAQALSGLEGVHPLLIVAIITTVVVFATEIGSNTAIVNVFLPIAGAVAIAVGVHPLLLIMPVAVAASYAFMMPMGTPPNALVFASGHLRIRDMATAGLVLNILAILVIRPRACCRAP